MTWPSSADIVRGFSASIYSFGALGISYRSYSDGGWGLGLTEVAYSSSFLLGGFLAGKTISRYGKTKNNPRMEQLGITIADAAKYAIPGWYIGTTCTNLGITSLYRSCAVAYCVNAVVYGILLS